jgi:hypothetical protein
MQDSIADMTQEVGGLLTLKTLRLPDELRDDVLPRISQMASRVWYTDVGSILGVAGFARFSRDDVRNTPWVRAFRRPYVSVSTPP